MGITLSTIGARGLVIYGARKDDDGTPKYYYVTEDVWRKYKIGAASDEIQALTSYRVVAATLTSPQQQVLVKLNELKSLEAGTRRAGEATSGSSVSSQTGQSVVVYDGVAHFAVDDAYWNALDPGAEGDAGVLINRGAIVAAIPQNAIPSGTYCVLVNMVGLQ